MEGNSGIQRRASLLASVMPFHISNESRIPKKQKQSLAQPMRSTGLRWTSPDSPPLGHFFIIFGGKYKLHQFQAPIKIRGKKSGDGWTEDDERGGVRLLNTEKRKVPRGHPTGTGIAF